MSRLGTLLAETNEEMRRQGMSGNFTVGLEKDDYARAIYALTGEYGYDEDQGRYVQSPYGRTYLEDESDVIATVQVIPSSATWCKMCYTGEAHSCKTDA